MQNYIQFNNLIKGEIMEDLQVKIEKAKESLKAVKEIEKLEKEIAKLKKTISTKQDKINDLAKAL